MATPPKDPKPTPKAVPQKAALQKAAPSKATEPEPPAITQAERDVAIERLKDSGMFKRQIIGSDPAKLSDADISDALQNLAEREFVADVKGVDVKDVKDNDFGHLV